VLDALVAIDTAERIVFTHGGRRLRYDVLAAATARAASSRLSAR
jgi:NAD(P)H-nitrite reductase large subunit